APQRRALRRRSHDLWTPERYASLLACQRVRLRARPAAAPPLRRRPAPAPCASACRGCGPRAGGTRSTAIPRWGGCRRRGTSTRTPSACAVPVGALDARSVGDADAQAAEALALVLDLDDLDPADLAGRGDVRATVGLLVQAHDVDDPDLLDLGRHEVGSGADDVGEGERLVPGQDPHVDSPPGGHLGVAGG